MPRGSACWRACSSARASRSIAVAVFLFSPFTRFVTFLPGPFLVGPLYAVALALLTLVAARRRSEAALAALGAVAGLGLTFPGVVPTVGFFGIVTVGCLLGDWRRMWAGAVAGLASFAAVVLPLLSARPRARRDPRPLPVGRQRRR